MEKCIYCGAKVIRTLSSSDGIKELTDCHNIFLNGEIYDKRNRMCYKRQLKQQAGLLGKALSVAKRSRTALVSFMDGTLVDDIELMDNLTALIPALEAALKEPK